MKEENEEEQLPEVRGAPAAEKDLHEKRNPIFSCCNILLMILAVVVGMIVTSVIVHTVDLKKLNDEQDDTIIKLKAEAEATKEKLQSIQSEYISKAESDQIVIKTLRLEKEELNSKIQALNTQMERVSSENHDTQQNMQKVIDKKEEEIAALSENLKKGFESFQVEKREISEQLKISVNDISTLQDKYDNDIKNIYDEKEDIVHRLNSIIAEKDAEILTNLKIQESLKRDVTMKANAEESLQKENKKLSNDLVELTESTTKDIKNIQEMKESCFKDLEKSKKSSLDEISKLKEGYKIEEEASLASKRSLENRITSLTSNHEKQIEELKNKNSQLNTDKQTASKEKAKYFEEKELLTKDLESLQLKLAKANEELEAEKNEKTSLSEEKISISNDLDTLQMEFSTITKECEDIRINQELCDKEKEQKSKELLKLDDQLFAQSENLSKMTEENNAVSERLSIVESERAEASKKLQEMERKSIALAEENTKLNEKLKLATENLSKLEVANNKENGQGV